MKNTDDFSRQSTRVPKDAIYNPIEGKWEKRLDSVYQGELTDDRSPLDLLKSSMERVSQLEKNAELYAERLKKDVRRLSNGTDQGEGSQFYPQGSSHNDVFARSSISHNDVMGRPNSLMSEDTGRTSIVKRLKKMKAEQDAHDREVFAGLQTDETDETQMELPEKIAGIPMWVIKLIVVIVAFVLMLQ